MVSDKATIHSNVCDDKTSRCVIVGGASIQNYTRVREYLLPSDFVICCDCGLRHCEGLERMPDLVVGDFDSSKMPDIEAETIILPREKDDTDTAYAVKEALRRGFSSFLLLGMVGERFDHTFCNISLLLMLEQTGATALLLDDYSEMELISKKTVTVEDRFSWFSLLSIGGAARGVTIRNAKYPLKDADINCAYQYGISNEVLPGCMAEVSVRQGCLLLIKVF